MDDLRCAEHNIWECVYCADDEPVPTETDGEDRSAGRWCAECGQHGSHHTDKHAEFRPAETDGEVEALRAEVKHWKDHAEEAGRGFTQVCRDAARLAARNVELSRRPAETDGLAEKIREASRTLDDLLAAIERGNYRYERVHVTADLTYLRALLDVAAPAPEGER